ncbi:NAD-dependent epimerase/dehydratase family protein [Planococcus sp. X10-3]|uniref:NAD-dependent epimerase/dehydratase family protein n=1 Tax=Planococcus sp. X10-3 TaxID=3061240 RepID=UPI003BB0A4F3
MKILVIGGTSFVGRHIVENALDGGHEVTLFNRGKSNPELFTNLPRITGDRKKDAGKLLGIEWDAVIDTSAYTPADLVPILDNITTDHYTFISTISVYDDFSNGPVNENSTIHLGIDSDEVNGKTYGPLKVRCEEIVNERFGEKALIIRPGIVAGAYDPTDRFTYWVLKLKEEGIALIPGDKFRKVQWVDARDLAEFTVSNLENSTNGTYNLTANPVTMEELVKTLASQKMKPVWVSDQILLDTGIKAFQLPLWMPVDKDHPEGYILADNSKAKKRGWQPKSLAETAEAVRRWKYDTLSKDLKTGIKPEIEKELLSLAKSNH